MAAATAFASGARGRLMRCRQRLVLQKGALNDSRPVSTRAPSMENLIIGLIAVLLLLYLVAAVLRPEKF
jgi:K+-transporting ATPase KdpF subunit